MTLFNSYTSTNKQTNKQTKSIAFSVARLFKHMADRISALILFILFSPIMLLTAIAIRIQLGSPVLYNQERPGLKGNIFLLYKFRTMLNEEDDTGHIRTEAERITPFGQWIRDFSLDELPQLLNVLKGEMSLVGPRPLLVRYLDRYTSTQARRHEVTPGITGWAQVNGRCELDSDWDKKLGLDVWYVDHWSLGLDFKILMLTVLKVLRREDIHQSGHATSEEFWGTMKNLNS